ncbi:MAG: hypothetical protein HY709_08980 [Candidatus Latescibacteria bacterium]|nr:hypothetical protein [Candidatus Latescibacterota bacterium]
MKQNSMAPRWAIPFTLLLIVGLSIHQLVSGERRYIPVKASLKQVYTLQNLYHIEHGFYTPYLDTLGFFSARDGYTYSVVIATDATFVIQGDLRGEGPRESWQIDETGMIRRIVQE